jgi:hypothetical protein
MSELSEQEEKAFVEDVKYILARNGEQPLSRLRATMCQGCNRLESLGGKYWKLGNYFYHGQMEDLLSDAGVIIRAVKKKSNPIITLAVYFSTSDADTAAYKALPDRPKSGGRHRAFRRRQYSQYDTPVHSVCDKQQSKSRVKVAKPYGLKWGDDSGTVITREYEKESERLRQVVTLAGNDNVTWTESFSN